MAWKCLLCGDLVPSGKGYVALGYHYHKECFPFKECDEKDRCYYCHKILRRGDTIISLGDIGMGGSSDRVCVKCADKHFAEEPKR